MPVSNSTGAPSISALAVEMGRRLPIASRQLFSRKGRLRLLARRALLLDPGVFVEYREQIAKNLCPSCVGLGIGKRAIMSGPPPEICRSEIFGHFSRHRQSRVVLQPFKNVGDAEILRARCPMPAVVSDAPLPIVIRGSHQRMPKPLTAAADDLAIRAISLHQRAKTVGWIILFGAPTK